MPQFENIKIQTLLNLALAKADAELNRNGFERLSQSLKECPQIETSIVTQKYLDERIYHQLGKARDEGKQHIHLKKEYLDQLAVYIGFDNYSNFEEKLIIVQAHPGIKDFSFAPSSDKFLSLVYDKDDANFLEHKFDQILYIGQSNPFRFAPVNLGSTEDKELTDQLTSTMVNLIFLNSSHLSNNPNLLRTISKGSSEQLEVIPVWSDEDLEMRSDPVSDMNLTRWLSLDDLDIFVQYFMSGLLSRSPSSADQENRPKSVTTNITDAGTVFLGKVGKIKAEYLSSRDMHININKSNTN